MSAELPDRQQDPRPVVETQPAMSLRQLAGGLVAIAWTETRRGLRARGAVRPYGYVGSVAFPTRS